ncbi:MAG: GHKL domain-containing protein [Bacteroidetes bacterium]|jgi:two-component system, NtrC family, nitrogen regulation sensor histidine kinase NtrY|nr:GHKL domain-containing protein [Bacteroidota bacterium]MBT3748509.1 GHKL domain-containing protein [Bacteroidota bacterium]MBT4398008.1 GHKL domain-containing protein [Bacteroidota bacterium]MBT4410849.1 GHKL domain-containing protein [Bacteroidota bacterium]MBT5424956.1 GHKL domain-containing protein [Bacteroidota bacterium]
MASKYFYHTVVFRILLITLTSFFLWESIPDWRFILITMTLFIVQIISLIYFLNHTNRKIAFFFEAIKNDDSTLHFPLISKNRTVKELNSSLNEVNNLIKQIRLDIQSQEHYYQMLLEQAETGILSIDQKGHIWFSNQAAKNYLQVETLTHVNQFQRIDQQLWEILKSMEPGNKQHLKFQTEKDKYDISLKSSRIKVKDQELLLVVLQDIKSEMEENESESWIRLIRVLTHEIMNSISPITSLSESLTHYLSKNNEETDRSLTSEEKLDKALTGLHVIKEQSQSLLDFVESYRDLTRLPKPEIKLIEAKTITETLMVLCQSMSNIPDAELNIAINPTDHMLMGDQEQLIQVLLNIVKNAYESVSKVRSAQIDIGISATNQGSVITVKDNGPGINPGIINEIFTPFFTTKESGTGIGLSLSKQIIRNHGGSISVHSIPGFETIFTIELINRF